jgi:hypothetical protein
MNGHLSGTNGHHGWTKAPRRRRGRRIADFSRIYGQIFVASGKTKTRFHTSNSKHALSTRP